MGSLVDTLSTVPSTPVSINVVRNGVGIEESDRIERFHNHPFFIFTHNKIVKWSKFFLHAAVDKVAKDPKLLKGEAYVNAFHNQ